MRQLYGLIDRVAASDVTVVIHGASGTGKVERLHEWSNGGSIAFEVTITTP